MVREHKNKIKTGWLLRLCSGTPKPPLRCFSQVARMNGAFPANVANGTRALILLATATLWEKQEKKKMARTGFAPVSSSSERVAANRKLFVACVLSPSPCAAPRRLGRDPLCPPLNAKQCVSASAQSTRDMKRRRGGEGAPGLPPCPFHDSPEMRGCHCQLSGYPAVPN